MNTFIGNHLKTVLEDRVPVLDAWRRQKMSVRRRPKNFENWLLVELVHHLWQKGVVDEVQTNGLVDGLPLKAAGLASRVRGPKAQSGTLSPDLSFRIKTHGIVDVEIKTGVSHTDIIDDLEVVRFYSEKGRARPEFAWVILIPEDAELEAAVTKGMNNIQTKARLSGIRFEFTEIKPWLRYAVWTPAGQAVQIGSAAPPNIR